MSNEPADAILTAIPESDVLSASVEAHLDQFPLDVDEAELEAALDRLEQRIGPAESARTPRWAWAVAALAVAALALVVARGLPEQNGDVNVPDAPLEVRRVSHPEAPMVIRTTTEGLDFAVPRRTVEFVGPAEVLATSDDRSAVLLVEAGTVRADDGTTVPEDHWALLTRVEDGSAHTVVFRDGEAHPVLEQDIWGGSNVEGQLRAIRWQVMPDRTLEMLDSLLSEEP